MTAIALLDVDGTTLSLDTEWYRRYNRDYQDNLKAEQVTRWAVHEFVKPSCGMKIYDYLLEPDLYENVPAIAGAMDGVCRLRDNGIRPVFVSSGIHRGKYLRLKELGFLTSEDDYYCAHDKSLIHGDYMLDDGFHNVSTWKRGLSILFNAPHNTEEYWKFRANTWNEAVDLILDVESRKHLERRHFTISTYASE